MAGNWLWRFLVVGLVMALPVSQALAQGAPPDPAAANAAASAAATADANADIIYTASAEALTKLAVIAVILEQALAIIFDWKLFRETFDRQAVKPIVSFLFALAIVHQFQIDILAGLVDIYNGPDVSTPSGMISKLVSALVLAGGSGGINRIMQKLGVRSNLNLKEDPGPPPTQAFVSVVPMPRSASTNIDSVTVVAIDGNNVLHSLGTVPGSSVGKDPTGIRAWFLQEKGRFPGSGGFAIDPGLWSIRLDAVDGTGNVSSSAVWGPYQLDAGAQIDLTLKV